MDDGALRDELTRLFEAGRAGDPAAVAGPDADRLIDRIEQRWSRPGADVRAEDVHQLGWLSFWRARHAATTAIPGRAAVACPPEPSGGPSRSTVRQRHPGEYGRSRGGDDGAQRGRGRSAGTGDRGAAG